MAYRYYRLKKECPNWNDSKKRNDFLLKKGFNENQIREIVTFEKSTLEERFSWLVNSLIHDWIIDHNNFGREFAIKTYTIRKKKPIDIVRVDFEITFTLKVKFLEDLEIDPKEKEFYLNRLD